MASENSNSFETKVANATFPDQAVTPLSFADYVTALRAKRICVRNVDQETSDNEWDISGIRNAGDNWQVPLVKCDSRKCSQEGEDALPFCEFAMVAVAGSNEKGKQRALEFKSWVETTYPFIASQSDMPFDFELVQIFDSSTAMNEYIKQIDYGKNVPKIAMGIVWEGTDDDSLSYRYELRPNSTNFNAPEKEGRPGTQTTPSTGTVVNNFARNDVSVCVPLDGTAEQGPFQNSCTGQYLYNGVLTFQRLVHDFIFVQSGAASAGTRVAEAGVQFAPFPTKEYESSGFYETIQGMYICLAYYR